VRRRLRLAGLLLLAVVPLLAGATTPATATPVAGDPLVTVRYSGTLDARSEPFGSHPRGPDVHESHIEWAIVWRGRLSELKVNASQRFATQRLTGRVTYRDNVQLPAETNRNDCTGTYSARRGVKVPVVVTIDPDRRKGFGVQLTRPTSDTYLVSSNKKSNFDFCTRVFAGLLPSKSQVVSPFFYFPPGGATRRNPIRSVQTVGDEKTRTIVDESVSLTVGGKPSMQEAAPNAKLIARDDLRRALERAKGPCLHFAIANGVIASGAVWTSVGAAIPGGIPAGGALITTGAVMGSATAPLCSEAVRQIVVSYSIYKKDPPVPNAVAAARLPSCTRWQGKVRAYCAELSAAVAELVAAEKKVLPVLLRLQAAAGKLTAARAKGNAQAVAAAEASVRSEARSLRSARSVSSAAGKDVGRIVSAAGVQGVLTKGQSAAVVDALLAELAARGVPASDLRRVAPSVLAPARIDVLAALAT
jgi:hypothetical protein